MDYRATSSDADEYIPSEDEDIYAIFDPYDGDMTAEEMLYSINSNVTQLNVTVSFTVSMAFAILIVYITLRPIFYFLK